MKYLAIMGSIRKNKNTDKALDAFLEGISDSGDTYEKLYLKDLNIKDCIACDHCSRTGECIFKDDMEKIYHGIDNYDGIIVAAPIYFNSVNSMTKTMIDRSQRYWGIKYGYGREKINIPNKLGMFITVGGADYTHDQFYGATPVIDIFFRAINADYKGTYCISETDQGLVSERKEILEELREIGGKFKECKKFFIQKIE